MTIQEANYAALRPELKEVTRRIHGISTLPQIALRVMEVANDPHSGAGELKDVMEGDPALSARVLRCVNSAAYATRTEITNLQQAIAYLGIKQVRNLAMAATIGELFSKEGNVGSYTRSGLWRHLVSVGICARLVATRQGFANFEDIFLAGLLHDVGLILEDEHVHKQFVEAINALHHERTLVETETTYLGFDHTILAESVTKSWHFPESVIAAVRYHHNSVAYRGEHINAVRCVEVANLLCSLKGICSVGINLVRFPQATVKALSLTKEDVLVLAKDLDHELAMNEKLFQM